MRYLQKRSEGGLLPFRDSDIGSTLSYGHWKVVYGTSRLTLSAFSASSPLRPDRAFQHSVWALYTEY
jgi:hypothetical protein